MSIQNGCEVIGVERNDDAWRGAHPPWGGAVRVIRRYKDRLGGAVTGGSGNESDTGGGDRLSPLRRGVRRCRQTGLSETKHIKKTGMRSVTQLSCELYRPGFTVT